MTILDRLEAGDKLICREWDGGHFSPGEIVTVQHDGTAKSDTTGNILHCSTCGKWSLYINMDVNKMNSDIKVGDWVTTKTNKYSLAPIARVENISHDWINSVSTLSANPNQRTANKCNMVLGDLIKIKPTPITRVPDVGDKLIVIKQNDVGCPMPLGKVVTVGEIYNKGRKWSHEEVNTYDSSIHFLRCFAMFKKAEPKKVC